MYNSLDRLAGLLAALQIVRVALAEDQFSYNRKQPVRRSRRFSPKPWFWFCVSHTGTELFDYIDFPELGNRRAGVSDKFYYSENLIFI